jgi:hypothetical protein
MFDLYAPQDGHRQFLDERLFLASQGCIVNPEAGSLRRLRRAAAPIASDYLTLTHAQRPWDG